MPRNNALVCVFTAMSLSVAGCDYNNAPSFFVAEWATSDATTLVPQGSYWVPSGQVHIVLVGEPRMSDGVVVTAAPRELGVVHVDGAGMFGYNPSPFVYVTPRRLCGDPARYFTDPQFIARDDDNHILKIWNVSIAGWFTYVPCS